MLWGHHITGNWFRIHEICWASDTFNSNPSDIAIISLANWKINFRYKIWNRTVIQTDGLSISFFLFVAAGFQCGSFILKFYLEQLNKM